MFWGFQLYGSSPTFNKVTWVGLIAVKNERAADVVVERRHWLTLGVRLVVLLDIKEKECRMTASLFNSFCINVAKQVACFLLPVFPYLKLVQRWPVSWIRSIQVAPHYLNSFKRTFQPKVVDALLVGMVSMLYIATSFHRYLTLHTWVHKLFSLRYLYLFCLFCKEYLQNLRNDPVRSRICKQRVLCRTLAGNFVYILTVTNPSRRPADAEVCKITFHNVFCVWCKANDEK